MVFGRKKKQEEDVLADETLNQDKDLDLPYGNEDELNDDLSTTGSVPPPPPTGTVTEATNEKKSQEDSRTLQESPSVCDSIDEKKEAELIKRKKLLLIAGCIISFFTLLGLSIKYGKLRNASKANALADGFMVSPITNSSDFLAIITSPPGSDPTEEIAATNTASTTGVDQQTPVPGIDPSIGGAGCVANEVSVVTTCNTNRVAAATMSFCLVDEVSDQFWAWVRFPERTPEIVATNWGWMEEGTEAELPRLPEGNYEIGLFSNGGEVLDEYPLITSTKFVVSCPSE